MPPCLKEVTKKDCERIYLGQGGEGLPCIMGVLKVELGSSVGMDLDRKEIMS